MNTLYFGAQGTGFYCLQSCANHSCAPSAATEGLASGATALLALKDLAPGEEVTLSYIGELEAEGGRPLGLKERQAMLRDWGFVCRCSRCLSEAAAKSSSAKKLGARAGVKVGRR
ncbi:SET domain-containing protein [Haematococcus lacustris]|uniref:SET domain-containing protein n=1 Tax=Haematococcus lacustris TaxID=44745 RepID=A0A699ZAY4_HAELA|nr:SET domain-containing protein [Haematococcus lacustris]